MGDKTMTRSPLLPDRFQQPDLFICDIFDAAPKSDMAGMEHPVFSISKRPDFQERRYENGDNYIEVSPSAKGMATVFDRDILIFCISQLIAALNEGRQVSKTVSFKVIDYLVAAGKPVGGLGVDEDPTPAAVAVDGEAGLGELVHRGVRTCLQHPVSRDRIVDVEDQPPDSSGV